LFLEKGNHRKEVQLMKTIMERRVSAGLSAIVAHGVGKRESGKKGRTPKPDRPLLDRLDEVADAITDILHYAQQAGLVASKEEGEDLAMRAVRNYQAEC